MNRLIIVLVLGVFGWLGIGSASAQVLTGDQGDAYSRCISALAAANRTHTPGSAYYGDPGSCPHDTYQGTYGRYTCKITQYNDNGTVRNPAANCIPGAYMWIYPLTSNCSAKAPLVNVYYKGEGGTCSGGCTFAVDIGAGISNRVIRLGNGGGSVTRVGRMTPTGDTCTVGDGVVAVQEQTTDQCQQQGNLTQCLTADGRTCAVASSGKKFCWEHSEAGIKVSGNEAAVKTPEGSAIKQPPKAPSNGGDWQQGGSGTVSVTSGGVTNNYSTTNYNSSYGSQGSGANGGGADGEGNGGSGEGEGEGNGSASGGGTCTQPYVCSGDPIMCSLGQQMWLSRCGDRKGDGNGDGIPDALVGDAPQNPDPGEDVNPTRWGINVGVDMLDMENIFGEASCPLMPAFTIMGHTVSPADYPQWCSNVATMRVVVLVMGAFTAICILMGWI